MENYDIIKNGIGFTGPSFSIKNRIARLAWMIAWIVFARWTPPQAHKIRIALLKLFGANISWNAYIYSDVEIWAPWNLEVADFGTLGRGVICYNIAPIKIGTRTVISQNAFLCTGSHDYLNPAFPLIARPISIGRRAWICANSFVGPGVSIGEGAILAATGTATKDLEPWSIYSGNPSTFLRSRPIIYD